MTRLERVKELDGDVLQTFLMTRRGNAIPEELRAYILQLNSVSNIIHEEGACCSKVARKLRIEYPELSYSQALNIFYDALNFFYVDDNVSAASWDNYYADRMEELYRKAEEEGNMKVAHACLESAHRLRTRNRNVTNPSDWTPPVFLISSRLTPEQLGFKKQEIFEIQRRQENKALGELIERLPTSEKEKKRLMQEASVSVEDAVIMEDEEDDTEE